MQRAGQSDEEMQGGKEGGRGKEVCVCLVGLFCQRFCLLLHSFVPLIGRPLALASETASTQTKGALNREEIDMEEEGGKREEREREKLFYTSISCPIMLLRADQERQKALDRTKRDMRVD